MSKSTETLDVSVVKWYDFCMKRNYKRGIVGLLITLIVRIAILLSIGFNSYQDQPGGFAAEMKGLFVNPSNILNYIISSFGYSPSSINSTTTVEVKDSIETIKQWSYLFAFSRLSTIGSKKPSKILGMLCHDSLMRWSVMRSCKML